MVSIYFAAPMFCKAELDFNRQVADALRRNGHTVFLPQEHACVLPTPGTDERHAVEEELFKEDIRMIDSSDVMLFIMDGRVPDEGACFELGYAYAKGKLLIGLKTDIRMSEQGGDNVMLSVPLRGGLVHSVPDLLLLLDGM